METTRHLSGYDIDLSPRTCARRGGFTLFEMLIAISIIVIITSIGWSPVMRLHQEYRVKAAAEEVRQMAAGTRMLALDQDLVFQFRFEPGGRKYMRVPYESAAGAAATTKQPVTASGQSSGELPVGTYFESVTAGASEAVNSEALANLPPEFTQTSWSPPILFYSDGTATNAEFNIVDETSTTRRIRVRDITGGVTVTTTN